MPNPDGIPPELARHHDAPLWLLVLIASRAARRTALAAPPQEPPSVARIILQGCDAVEACAAAGCWISTPALTRAASVQPSTVTYQAALAFQHAAGAARAADAALDFSAAETSCIRSIWRSLREACRAEPACLQEARLELDSLRAECRRAGVGRYDAIPPGVRGLLAPIVPSATEPNP